MKKTKFTVYLDDETRRRLEVFYGQLISQGKKQSYGDIVTSALHAYIQNNLEEESQQSYEDGIICAPNQQVCPSHVEAAFFKNKGRIGLIEEVDEDACYMCLSNKD